MPLPLFHVPHTDEGKIQREVSILTGYWKDELAYAYEHVVNFVNECVCFTPAMRTEIFRRVEHFKKTGQIITQPE